MDEKSYDETDKLPNSNHVTYLDLGSLLFSFILHFVDIGFDFYVAFAYYTAEKYFYFAWTVAFIVLPSIILTTISVRMYVEDYRGKKFSRQAIVRIVLCVLGIIFQAALPIRYFDSLHYAIKSLKAEHQSNKKQQKKFFLKMLNEDMDIALLRVFECYLESAPQQALQIILLITDYIRGSSTHTRIQIILLVLGFIAMGFCMANYHRCIRFDQKEKNNISALGIAVQFCWHLNFTALATIYSFWTCIAVVTHWCVMTIWLAVSRDINFCGENKIFQLLFCCAVGAVYIFNLLNIKEGPTKKSYISFYSLCFVENVIAATVWGVKSTLVKNWIYYIFIVIPILCFILSVGFLILYYQYLHPNKLKSSIKNDKNIVFGDNMQNQRFTVTNT